MYRAHGQVKQAAWKPPFLLRSPKTRSFRGFIRLAAGVCGQHKASVLSLRHRSLAIIFLFSYFYTPVSYCNEVKIHQSHQKRSQLKCVDLEDRSVRVGFISQITLTSVMFVNIESVVFLSGSPERGSIDSYRFSLTNQRSSIVYATFLYCFSSLGTFAKMAQKNNPTCNQVPKRNGGK